MRWADALGSEGRILLVVNSQPQAQAEVTRVVNALRSSGVLSRLAVLAPAPLSGDLIRCGISGDSVLSFDVEVGYFLESARAIQWSIRQQASVVMGSEPYAPNNEEVKFQFERSVAPLIGRGRFLTHSLPHDEVFLLSVDDLWRRAARPSGLSAHSGRVEDALQQLHSLWSEGAQPNLASSARALATSVLEASRLRAPAECNLAQETARSSYDRLHEALLSDGGYPPTPVRVAVDPVGASPRAGWLGGRIEAIRRPAHTATGVLLHGGRFIFRGPAAEPFSALLMSRYSVLSKGDAAVAEGRLYRGGLTIGLVKDGDWVSRVDVIDRGPFVAAVSVQDPGRYALVVANCLHGSDRRTAVAIRQLGFRRAER